MQLPVAEIGGGHDCRGFQPGLHDPRFSWLRGKLAHFILGRLDESIVLRRGPQGCGSTNEYCRARPLFRVTFGTIFIRGWSDRIMLPKRHCEWLATHENI